MRMPSTPSLWPALLGSFGLHALVVFGAWYLGASDSCVPMKLGTCVEETTDRLKLSVIFGKVTKSGQPPKPIDTKIDDPTATDPTVELEETPAFNPLNSSLASVHPIGAPLAVQRSPAVVGTQNKSGGQPGPGVGGLGARGTGGASLFQVAATGHSVVYVIDRSGSMRMKLSRASAELLTSLQQLPLDLQFQVVAYNHQPPHCLVGPDRLLPAQPEIVAQFVQALDALLPSGSTNHVAALQCALVLNPEAIYLVTDADDLTVKDVQKVSNWNRGRTAIHVIEMASHRTPQLDGPLMQLASNNRGTYRYVSPPQ
jgi:hypothetical protein